MIVESLYRTLETNITVPTKTVIIITHERSVWWSWLLKRNISNIKQEKNIESNSSETLEENALLFIYIMAHPYTKLLYNYHKILSWVYYVLAWKMLSYTDV